MFAIQRTIYGDTVIWTGETREETTEEQIEDHKGQTYLNFESTPPLPLFCEKESK